MCWNEQIGSLPIYHNSECSTRDSRDKTGSNMIGLKTYLSHQICSRLAIEPMRIFLAVRDPRTRSLPHKSAWGGLHSICNPLTRPTSLTPFLFSNPEAKVLRILPKVLEQTDYECIALYDKGLTANRVICLQFELKVYQIKTPAVIRRLHPKNDGKANYKPDCNFSQNGGFLEM